MCGLFWHPTCSDIVMKTVTTSALQETTDLFPSMATLRELVAALGDEAWTKFSRYVVKVSMEASASSSANDGATAGLHNTPMNLVMHYSGLGNVIHSLAVHHHNHHHHDHHHHHHHRQCLHKHKHMLCNCNNSADNYLIDKLS